MDPREVARQERLKRMSPTARAAQAEREAETQADKEAVLTRAAEKKTAGEQRHLNREARKARRQAKAKLLAQVDPVAETRPLLSETLQRMRRRDAEQQADRSSPEFTWEFMPDVYRAMVTARFFSPAWAPFKNKTIATMEGAATYTAQVYNLKLTELHRDVGIEDLAKASGYGYAQAERLGKQACYNEATEREGFTADQLRDLAAWLGFDPSDAVPEARPK